MRKIQKVHLLLITIIGIVLMVSFKHYNRNKSSRYLYEKFESNYNADINQINDNDVFIYLNDIPIDTKKVLFYNSIASIEHEYYGSKSSIEDSAVNAIIDSLYIQIIHNNYHKDIKVNDLEDIRNTLQIQYKKGSELVSTVSKIRLDYSDEAELWIKGKYAFNYMENEIMRNNSNIKKEDLGKVMLNEIFDLSRGYKIKFTPKFYEYCDKKIFEEKLKEYNFVFSD